MNTSVPSLRRLRSLLLVPLVSFWAACGEPDEAPAPVSSKVFEPLETRDVWRLPGLQGRVEVARDRYGIPHLYAENLHDLMYVQGYVVARDRFWEMDILRRISLGKLSTLIGLAPILIDFDELFRAINLTERGTLVYDEVYATTEGEDKVALDAYAAGVNLYLEHAATGKYGARFPPEYNELLFGLLQQPTPADIPRWEPRDTLAVGRFQQFNLSASNYAQELRIGDLLATMGAEHPDWAEALIRFRPAVTQATLSDWAGVEPGVAAAPGLNPRSPQNRALSPAAAADAAISSNAVRTLLVRLDEMRTQFPLLSWTDYGSNNWVVGPDRSASGHVLVANDPHLIVTNPPLFYQVHLNTKVLGGDDGLNASGVVFPGIPVFMIAHNESVAWGVTVLGYDVADIYREQVLGDGTAVRRGATSVPIMASQQFYCDGYSDTCLMRPLKYVPGHGPVIEEEGNELLTLRWTGMEPTGDLTAFRKLAYAKNVDEAFEAIRDFRVGAQSFVLGDVEGNIGYFGSANVPIRDPRCAQPPWIPLDGASGLCEWQGYLPDELLVQTKNPAQGYVATANNDIVGTSFDNDPLNDYRDGTQLYYWYTRDAGFRAGRIHELLDAKEKHTREDMARIQADTFSFEGRMMTPHILAAASARPDLVSPALEDALERLAAWEFGTPTGMPDPFTDTVPTSAEERDSVAASIYYTWIRLLKDRLMGDEYARYGLTPPSESDGYEPLGTFRAALHALEDPSASFLFDDIRTTGHIETPAETILATLDDTVTWLTERFGTADSAAWKWGELHYVRFFDIYGFLGANVRAIGPFPNDGSLGTVDAASFLFMQDSYVQVGGPVMRMITELDPDGVRSWNALPGGQVHDRFSNHYDDLVPYWMQNRNYEVPFSLDDVRANLERLTIVLPPE